MIEAVKTTASPAEIWAIVVVAVACLAFWLSMVAWADMHPRWRGRQVAEMQGPVLGGMHVAGGGRSVSPNREAPSVLTDVDEVPYDRRDYDPEDEEAAQWREAPVGGYDAWIPVPRTPEPQPAQPQQPEQQVPAQAQPTQAQETQPPVPAMPAQRTAEADEPEQSLSGPMATDDWATISRHWWSRRR